MKKIIVLILALLMIIPMFCSCGLMMLGALIEDDSPSSNSSSNFSTKANSTTVETEPIIEESIIEINGITIIYPSSTLKLSDYNMFDNKVSSSCEVYINDIEYDSSFIPMLKVTCYVRKTYDRLGKDNMSECEFKYRLEDETDGIVIKSSVSYTEDILVGEKVIEEVNIFETLLKGHTYRLSLIDSK